MLFFGNRNWLFSWLLKTNFVKEHYKSYHFWLLIDWQLCYIMLYVFFICFEKSAVAISASKSKQWNKWKDQKVDKSANWYKSMINQQMRAMAGQERAAARITSRGIAAGAESHLTVSNKSRSSSSRSLHMAWSVSRVLRRNGRSRESGGKDHFTRRRSRSGEPSNGQEKVSLIDIKIYCI